MDSNSTAGQSDAGVAGSKEANGSSSDGDPRAAIRYPAAAVTSITGVRLSPGEAGTLVNISTSGLLLESATRYTPGSRVMVFFEGDIGTKQIRGRVVRCEVSAIKSGVLHYRTAVAYATPLALPFDEAPTDVPLSESPPAASPRVINRW